MKRGSGARSTPWPYLAYAYRQIKTIVKRKSSLPRHDLSTLQRLPEVRLDIFMRDLVPAAELLLHGKLPAKDLLIRQTVKRTSEGEERSRIGEEGIR